MLVAVSPGETARETNGKQKMYLDTPLETYLNDLASGQSTPGGGSASALTGALAASLASMVARLTLSKVEYAAVHAEIETILAGTERLRVRFGQLMQEDIDAYGRLSACFKMPRATAEERTARTQAIQARLVEAALVPLEIAESAAQLVVLCQRIAEIGNTNVLSDIATGATLAASAGNAASWMVRTNLHAMKDHARIAQMDVRLTTALNALEAGRQRVIDMIGERA